MTSKKLEFGDFSDQFRTLENSEIVLLPVAYDATSTWIKGADKGPQAILQASYNLENYDIETDFEVYRKGIYTDDILTPPQDPEEMVRTVASRTSEFLDTGKFCVVIGGEHSVSLGPVYANCEKYDDLTILQLDAHSDLRQEFHGSRFNHACVMARAKEKTRIVQVGIRSMDIEEKALVCQQDIFFAKDIYNSKNWHQKVLDRIGKNVYITIDLDVFDPSIMPSTGTPEPGGLFWYDIIGLMNQVFKYKRVTGFDVVEMCPRPDNKAPDFLAAKLIYKLLSYRFVD